MSDSKTLEIVLPSVRGGAVRYCEWHQPGGMTAALGALRLERHAERGTVCGRIVIDDIPLAWLDDLTGHLGMPYIDAAPRHFEDVLRSLLNVLGNIERKLP